MIDPTLEPAMNPRAMGQSVLAMALMLCAASTLAEDAGALRGRAALDLSEVEGAESILTTAIVRDRQGAELGRVHGVTRGADGEVKTLQIATEAGVIVLAARQALYFPQSNEIRTGVTRAEARSMPVLEP